jgi:hypothetical protein
MGVNKISKKLLLHIQDFLNEHWIEGVYLEKNMTSKEENYIFEEKMVFESSARTSQVRSLEDLINNLDDKFSQMLLRLIDEKDLTDVEAYKRAHVDRRHFSKIRSNMNYKPSKNTVLSFCIGLKLNIDESIDLLQSAGFSLSSSSKFDVIVQYFIENERYNLFEVNEALETFEEKILSV